MDSLTNREFERIYRRLDVIMSLRGAVTKRELSRRLRKIRNAKPKYRRNINTLINHGFIVKLLEHYYEGRDMGRYSSKTSRRIYKRMKKRWRRT